MAEINPRSTILNGVWIQETYEGAVDTNKGGTFTLRRNYQLRKKGSSHHNQTQEMHQTEAYAALQSFILRFQYGIDYRTNEGTIRMWASKVKADVDRNNYPVYKGEVTWEHNPRNPNYIVQPVTWSDRMIGGTRKMAYPIEQQRYYLPPGMTFAVNYDGVNYNNRTDAYEGVECFSPEWRMIAKQQLLASLVTHGHRRMLQHMSKTVNSQPFRGFDPGCVLYLGADMDESFHHDRKVVDLTHQFVVEPNMVNFSIGGIPVDRKLGHEYLWLTSAKTLAGPIVTQVNVAPMYATTNLNLLGLG